jgi:hypothetical protein
LRSENAPSSFSVVCATPKIHVDFEGLVDARLRPKGQEKMCTVESSSCVGGSFLRNVTCKAFFGMFTNIQYRQNVLPLNHPSVGY